MARIHSPMSSASFGLHTHALLLCLDQEAMRKLVSKKNDNVKLSINYFNHFSKLIYSYPLALKTKTFQMTLVKEFWP